MYVIFPPPKYLAKDENHSFIPYPSLLPSWDALSRFILSLEFASCVLSATKGQEQFFKWPLTASRQYIFPFSNS